MLAPGQWFMWPVGSQLPETVRVCSGPVIGPETQFYITRAQALALIRWFGEMEYYYSYMDENGRWYDMRVVGDTDEWKRGNEMLTEKNLYTERLK